MCRPTRVPRPPNCLSNSLHRETCAALAAPTTKLSVKQFAPRAVCRPRCPDPQTVCQTVCIASRVPPSLPHPPNCLPNSLIGMECLPILTNSLVSQIVFHKCLIKLQTVCQTHDHFTNCLPGSAPFFKLFAPAQTVCKIVWALQTVCQTV